MTKVERKNSLLTEEMTLKYKFLIFPFCQDSEGLYIFVQKENRRWKNTA